MDCVFIAHAHNDVPALIAEVRRLRMVAKCAGNAEEGHRQREFSIVGRFEIAREVTGERASAEARRAFKAE